MPSTNLADDAALVWTAFQQLQKSTRVHKSIPQRTTVDELAGLLQWSQRRTFAAIGHLRDDGKEIANFGDGYFIAETRDQMESACALYKKRALSALNRLRIMSATAVKLPVTKPEAQRDFFKETISEIQTVEI